MIDTHKSSVELDSWIAEQVMGWKHLGGLSWKTEEGTIRSWEDTSFRSFRPSLHIESAWEVVEKITTDWNNSPFGFGTGFTMHYRNESSEARVRVILSETTCAPPYEEMKDLVDLERETAPLAICAAAYVLKMGIRKGMETHSND